MLALVATGSVLKLLDRPKDDEPRPIEPLPAGCCGQHEVCERDFDPVSELDYFEDETLDRFKGRPEGEYSGAEADEFREVMLTLRSDEIGAWEKALRRRGIALPTDLRDEFLLLLAEK